jgi:hypothetical protein
MILHGPHSFGNSAMYRGSAKRIVAGNAVSDFPMPMAEPMRSLRLSPFRLAL